MDEVVFLCVLCGSPGSMWYFKADPAWQCDNDRRWLSLQKIEQMFMQLLVKNHML